MPEPLIVFGTHNVKKAEELAEVFAGIGLRFQSLADYPSAITVDETGDTFEANARLKAVEQARHLGRWVLGEDSGLAVDALQGAPGVYSARYSGPAATDQSNNDKLLLEIKDVPLERRTAHYACHMALSDAQGNVRAESRGICRGRMRFEPVGSGGFGYDPLFEVLEYHRTFAELGSAVKAVLSHRARAAEQLIQQFMELVGASVLG